MITVLITGCSHYSLGVIKALRNNFDGEQFRIIGIDCNKYNLLKTGVDAGYVVPRITEPDYIPKVLEICKSEHVDIVMPYITAELELMAEKRPLFETEGIKVSVASPETIAVVNDKMALYEKFDDMMPLQWYVKSEDELKEIIWKNPDIELCCKLTNGCGGRGFAIIDDEKASDLTMLNSYGIDRYINVYTLSQCLKKHNTHTLISQYIDGVDYSVYVLADHGKVAYKCGIIGHVVGYGAIMNGEIAEHQGAYEIAEKVVNESELDGNACLDFKISKSGHAYLLEVNPRLSATIPFIAEAGLNLPYLRCCQLIGKSIDGLEFSIRYGLKMSKYYVSEYYV